MEAFIMNINIVVTTKSGSVYELQQKGEKLMIQKGLLLTGEVVELHEPIRIGGVLHVDFIRDSLYCTPNTSKSFLRSTAITDITIR